MNEISDWMTTHVADLFGGPASVLVDREEITVVGPLPTADTDSTDPAAAYRERTRVDRMAVAREAEELFRRKVSWGVQVGADTVMFTHLRSRDDPPEARRASGAGHTRGRWRGSFAVGCAGLVRAARR